MSYGIVYDGITRGRMRSQTKEHTEISAADVLNGGEIGDRQTFITKCCQIAECYENEIKNSQESF